MAITKENVSVLGLHLVSGNFDGVLTYSDNIADTEFEHFDTSRENGGFQSDINVELREAIKTESTWHEED